MNGAFHRLSGNQVSVDQQQMKESPHKGPPCPPPGPGYHVSYPDCTASYPPPPPQPPTQPVYTVYTNQQPQQQPSPYYCNSGVSYEMPNYDYNYNRHPAPPPPPQTMGYPYMCYPGYPNYMSMPVNVGPYPPPHYQPAPAPGYPGFCYGNGPPPDNYGTYQGYTNAPPPGYYYPPPVNQQCLPPGSAMTCEQHPPQPIPSCSTNITQSAPVSAKTYPYSSNEYPTGSTYSQSGDTLSDSGHCSHTLPSSTNCFKMKEDSSPPGLIPVSTPSNCSNLHDNNNTNSGDCDEVICSLKAAVSADRIGEHCFRNGPDASASIHTSASPSGGFGAVGLERAQLAASVAAAAETMNSSVEDDVCLPRDSSYDSKGALGFTFKSMDNSPAGPSHLSDPNSVTCLNGMEIN